ncbi:HAD-IIIA family hydrolase [Vibrio navarrensis]
MSLKTNHPIKLVLFDVDGVLTDGTIYVSESGEYFKSFNVKDGIAIELLRANGIRSGVISGKSSPALRVRCEQLNFDIIEMGCKNKLPKLEQICVKLGISKDNIAFCGDDVLDIAIMSQCAIAVAPSDAHELVLDAATWISELPGGKGMVRQFVDQLLMAQMGYSLKQIYEPLMEKIRQDDLKGLEQ